MTDPMLKAALKHADRGLAVFPVQPACRSLCDNEACQSKAQCQKAKRPYPGTHGVKDATTDPAKVRSFWGRFPGSPIAMATGAASNRDVLDLDLKTDPRTGEVLVDGIANLGKLVTKLGVQLPVTRSVRSPRGGLHHHFKHVVGAGNSAGKIGPGIDTRGDGGYVLIPPSPGYEIENDAPLAEMPSWLAEAFRDPSGFGRKHGSDQGGQSKSAGDGRAYALKVLRGEAAKVARAEEGTRNDTLNIAALKAGHYVPHLLSVEEVTDALLEAALKAGLDEREASATIASGLKKGMSEPREESPLSPIFSDDALANRFADARASVLRYVAPWGKWLHWDGKRWQNDETMFVRDLVRDLCREAAAGCNRSSEARRIASAKTVTAVERLAMADRRLAATVDQWDADPWLLNTPGGVVDLRTGQLLQHDPTRYLMKSTAVAPGGSPSLWLNFLQRVTNGDKDLQSFLQRIAGYALTGDTSHHALFFLYGTGSNGKSVFIDTLSNVLGSYHRTAPIETFTASFTDKHPTDLAGLMGARLVSSVETEEGRRWAESRIKQLTGGDKISARLMRQDFFEYTPQFKLIIAGNHRPGLRSVDEAIRRRLNLIPFTAKIPAHERDPKLKEKLKSEWPAILAWAIQGCLDWQRRGLDPPRVVLDHTAAYLDAEDALSSWIDECCERDSQAWTSSTDLFSSWTEWSRRAGEYTGSQKKLSEALEGRDFTPRRRASGRGFTGLRLKTPAEV